LKTVWQARNGQTSPGDCSDHKLERWVGWRDTHTRSLAENEKAIASTALSAKREIFSNKYFMIFFFCTLFSLGVVIWQAVRTSKWSRVASNQSESEKTYPGSEGGEHSC